MATIKVRATLLEEMLGGQPGNPQVHETYIASKAPDAKSREEEIAAIGVDAEVDKLQTVFHRDKDGNPCLMDYQVKGFFKSAADAYNRASKDAREEFFGASLEKLSAQKKKIDLLVFVFAIDGGRFIKLNMPDDGEVSDCQRPLRAQTAQGERVALANSETVPAGTTLEFEIQIFDKALVPYVRAWLNYGKYNGLGQWRNSGKGRYIWEEIA